MNPVIGDISKGKDIGKKGGSATSYFMWSACMDCSLERWVICSRGIPRNKRCKRCGGKYASQFPPKRYGEDNLAWIGGRVKLGDYIGIRQPDHPKSRNGYVLEHILVWEKANNKILPNGWIIHHLNGVKDDNRPENLLALPRQKHHTELVNNALKVRVRELELALGMADKF